MNKREILESPIVLDCVLSAEYGYQLKAFCGLEGEVSYEVVDRMGSLGVVYTSRSMDDAICRLNQIVEAKQ